jgi:hypothetical protein
MQTCNEWRPIETAPKDDTKPLLGWVPSYYCGRGGIAVILWQGGKWWDNSAFETNPTHWMLLPEPPK